MIYLIEPTTNSAHNTKLLLQSIELDAKNEKEKNIDIIRDNRLTLISM